MLLECPNRMAITSSHRRPWERVAQPVEHVTFNHGVLGSSPSALTKYGPDQARLPLFSRGLFDRLRSGSVLKRTLIKRVLMAQSPSIVPQSAASRDVYIVL